MLRRLWHERRRYFGYFLGSFLVMTAPIDAVRAANSYKKPAAVTRLTGVPSPKSTPPAKKKRRNLGGNQGGVPSVKSLPTRKIVVAIDAGHGGKDPGAIGPTGLQEKQVTLAIAYRLAALLRQDTQFTPVLIRTHDQFIPVGERSTLARQQQAQLLISIHADGAVNHQARGASVWVLSNQRAHDEVGRRLTQPQPLKQIIPVAQNSGDYHLCHALLDLQFGHSQQVGYQVASSVLRNLGKIAHLHKLTPEYASLGVLQSPDIPSLLVESGFITNSTEERLLRSHKYQQQVAIALYQGIKGYYQNSVLSQPPPLAKQKASNSSSQQDLGAPVAVTGKEHVVQGGETLFAIARRYEISWRHLQQHNQLPNHLLRVGQRLQIPVATQLVKQPK